MKIKTRFLLSSTILVIFTSYLIFNEFTKNLKPQFRKTTEETLIDTSRLLAKIAALSTNDDTINIELFRNALAQQSAETFHAELFDSIKSTSDLKVFITDSRGIVLFDSNNGKDEGKDYSTWRDIQLTLSGKYGARTSHDPNNKSSMYVSAPIQKNSRLIGVLTLVKPTERINSFVESAANKILFICIISTLLIMITFSLISLAVTKPLDKLITYARSIRDGKRQALPNLGSSEIKELGQAFLEMKNALEGKKYIENYVQTLTHEIKAPVSAIKGAAELLQDNLPEEVKIKFTNNIMQQNDRIEQLVNNLLFLSQIENRLELDKLEEIEIFKLYNEIIADFKSVADKNNISFDFQGNKHTKIQGDAFLLKIALNNVFKNALEFSPENSQLLTEIHRKGEEVVLRISDNGPGIPEYAKEKIFDRFYSLPRPNGAKKSSGLGLTFVKEILDLHHAKITLSDNFPNGTVAEIRFYKKLSAKL